MPYAECSECKAPSGEYGCNALQRVTIKNRVAGLCCECVRKNGSKVTGHQFNWTSDSCKPCRDRKFAKCGGIFQKRTLSSSCVCGLSLAEHNITAHLHQNAAKPPSHTGADERDTQPSVPPGAQGAWDIAPSSQPERRENGEWQKFTDVPDSSFKYDDIPINMQLGLDDNSPLKYRIKQSPTRPSQEEEQQRQQQSMQTQKLLSKVKDRIEGGTGGMDCDTLAELAEKLQVESLEKEALWGQYQNLEQQYLNLQQQMEATVQHVMKVMGNEKKLLQDDKMRLQDDKMRLTDRTDRLTGELNQLNSDKKKLIDRLQASDKANQKLTKDGAAAKKHADSVMKAAKAAYATFQTTSEEADSQAAASKHGAEVANIVRKRHEESLALAVAQSKAIDALEERVDKGCAAARVRAEDHAELEEQSKESARRIDELTRELEALSNKMDEHRAELERSQGALERALQEKDEVVHELERVKGEWDNVIAERLAEEGGGHKSRADLAEHRAAAAEEALLQAMQQLQADQVPGGAAGAGGAREGVGPGGVCWSVQKGGIKVLRVGGQPAGNMGGSQAQQGTASHHGRGVLDAASAPGGVGLSSTHAGIVNQQQSSMAGAHRGVGLTNTAPSASVAGGGGGARPQDEYQTVEIGKDEVVRMGEIAEGSFGIVYRGEWEGAGVAVKEMRIPAANLSKEELEVVLDEYRREVTRLCQLRHPNVLSFFGTVTDLPMLGIVTELMDRDMRRYLKSPSPQSDPLAARLGLARQAFCGVAYLHRRRLVHRDIKPENFLLTGQGSGCVVKVCDFGLARVKEASHINTMRTAGTMTYIAPEVHRGEPFDERSDVYSLSIVTWELVTLQTPFSDKNMASIPGIVGWGQQRPSPLALDECLRQASHSMTTQGEIRALICDGWSHDPAWRHTSQEGVTRVDACIRDLLEEGDEKQTIAA